MKPGGIEEAEVVDLAHDGRGVARRDGKAVFIDGALPGERVRFRVFKRRAQLDEAGLVEILRASPERVVPPCAHFGLCGGCALQHLAPSAQVQAKQRQLLDSLERIGRVTPERVFEPLRGAAQGYRRRARLGVRFVHKKGRVLAGFRERDKPYVADLERCEVLLERFATLPGDLAALVGALSVRERIAQVEVAAGDSEPGGSTAAALVFRILSTPTADDIAKLTAFGAAHAVQIFLQSGGLETVRPLVEGYPPLNYAVDGGRVQLEFGPVDFIQVNAEINRKMVELTVDTLDPGPEDRVLDLFCGLGNFTLSLGRRAARVVGVEGDPGLVDAARANAGRNGVLNAEFNVANLFDTGNLGVWAEDHYDLVLLDPPRAGAAEILERVAHWQPRRLVYISCHPASLARDAGILVAGLGFRLVGAGVMDMFPHTTHVESIAVFEHRR